MIKKNISVIAGLSFVTLTVAALEYISLKKTGGHFCYPLDDTFIHMAVAKNLALHGNWGITPTGFVSTSSSPLFTILLAACFKIGGLVNGFPFLLSCAGTVLTLVAMQQELNQHSTLSAGNKAVTILLTLLAAAIPALTLLGMEHTLQIAFTLFFVHRMASLLTDYSQKNLLIAAAWGLLMTATRYENASFLIAAFALLCCQRKFFAAVFVPAVGILPLIIFGIYSKMHGGYFMPNSVMIKGNQNFMYFVNGGTSLLQATSSISAIIVTAIFLVLLKLHTKTFDRDFWILFMLIIAGLTHSVFASFGWFYRYEAYLIVLGMLHLTKIGLQWLQVNGKEALRKNMVAVVMIGLIFYSLPVRGINSFRNSIRAIYNIYEQQYQMGLFLKAYYPKQTVAANDIGAISYMADLNTIDMWGLGNNQVAAARKGRHWSSAFLQKLVADNHTRVAVMYDSWFNPDLTTHWTKVATWQMPYNYICGDIKVTFYGMTVDEANLLKQNLSAFSTQLPTDVKVEYFK